MSTVSPKESKSAQSDSAAQRQPPGLVDNPAVAQELLEAFDALFGLHAGFRPAHAKGIMCSGMFTPTPDAATLTRAPHARRSSTPVTVRFSNSTGLPNLPDNDPHAVPHGIAIRFHLGDHIHTDIIGHSADGFPVRTGEDFLELLQAAASAAAGRPDAIAAFFETHPEAKRFEDMPKPFPTSFAREAYFAITSFKFIDENGLSHHGRFRIRPSEGTEYFSNDQPPTSENYLFDEIKNRLASRPVELRISVQIAESGDDVTNASVSWPASRREVPFGTIVLSALINDQEPESRKVIFDPLPRVDGIESSGDPLTQVRADLYLLSGRRRRAAVADQRT